ncbi:diguanylate cyclase [Streptomyces abikoensis]|uniref:diguanylate cyclase n=1 Tax=Streptomyces abikoensis TaxID=97398 RepID=UPI003722DD1A
MRAIVRRRLRRFLGAGVPGAERFVNREARRHAGVDDATRRMLVGFVVPLWIGAGLADWWLHRRSGIERTAGTRESVIHAVMLTEAGFPVVLGLFCQVDAGVLAWALLGLCAHQATAFWDVAYAEERRRVTTTEQHVHSLLETVPLMAVLSLTALHWDQALALFGRGPARPDFRLRPKARPLSGRARAGVLASVALCIAVPYAEELWRCARVNPSLASRPRPPLPATPTLRIGNA